MSKLRMVSCQGGKATKKEFTLSQDTKTLPKHRLMKIMASIAGL